LPKNVEKGLSKVWLRWSDSSSVDSAERPMSQNKICSAADSRGWGQNAWATSCSVSLRMSWRGGWRTQRPGRLPFARSPKSPWAVKVDGFSVEAGARFGALDRKGRKPEWTEATLLAGVHGGPRGRAKPAAVKDCCATCFVLPSPPNASQFCDLCGWSPERQPQRP
jgi:hypothetical protein